MLKSRLAAESSPALLVMGQEHLEMIHGTHEYRAREFGGRDPWVDRLTKISTSIEA